MRTHTHTRTPCYICTLPNDIIGLGRSKFLPKPLPQEINMLLSECDLNCHHEMTEKSGTAVAAVTSATSSPALAATVNVNNCIDGGVDSNNMEATEDEDDDNRIG